MGELTLGEQCLGHHDAMPVEELLIGIHQSPLANGCQYLPERDVLPVTVCPELVTACGYGSGGYQHDLQSLAMQLSYLVDKSRHGGNVETSATAGEQVRAQLDHQPAIPD